MRFRIIKRVRTGARRWARRYIVLRRFGLSFLKMDVRSRNYHELNGMYGDGGRGRELIADWLLGSLLATRK